MTDQLNSTLELPCGAVLTNRIAKSAMTEGLADEYDSPTDELANLFRQWSEGGAGLLMTGNVMIDRRYLERPGNVVLDDRTDFDAVERWANAGTVGGNHLWMQLSHPGRQVQRTTNPNPVAPSAVKLKIGGFFAAPRALSADEIRDLVAQWAWAAAQAKDAGFTGVQIHSAHGYLPNQFLSPRTNRRTDEWGGSLENRARFLLEVTRAIRGAVGDDFPVSVKLNSSDFQKGGFTNEEAAQVATWLAGESVDLLELSGGTYEQLAFAGQFEKAESTRAREAYFLEYARIVRDAAPDVPIMLTGGFRTADTMEMAVAEGVIDVVGLARPFCTQPDFPRRLLTGEIERLETPEQSLILGNGPLGPGSSSRFVRTLNSLAGSAWFYHQLLRLGAGQPIDRGLGARRALAQHMMREQKKNLARKMRK